MQRNGQKCDKKKSMGKYDRKKVFFERTAPTLGPAQLALLAT
jgi:hypothetical protein